MLQAERAMDEFRTQSEASTNAMFSQMRREVRVYICVYVCTYVYVHSVYCMCSAISIYTTCMLVFCVFMVKV